MNSGLGLRFQVRVNLYHENIVRTGGYAAPNRSEPVQTLTETFSLRVTVRVSVGVRVRQTLKKNQG